MASKKYSIAEARSSLPTIVDEAEAGIEIELTRRGKPVAVVISRKEIDRLRRTRRSFSEAYEAFLSVHSPREVGIDDEFVASLRQREAGRLVRL